VQEHKKARDASEGEIQDASLQFVRKISGYRKPSKANEEAFRKAVEQISLASRDLLDSLVVRS
jgi:hypothetical protein